MSGADVSVGLVNAAGGLTVEDRIKSFAREIGFAACGITDMRHPPHHREYRKWLAEGNAGEMLYLNRQEPKRGDLNEVLPGVKSVVAVAFNYYTEQVNSGSEAGVIARYARFDDYHQTVWSKLQQLLSYIIELVPGSEGKLYCDTGPITERDLAMSAGLGWIGKHTNLISRRLGNWFFLGEILLTAEMTPDRAETVHCGTCSRCIPACPTGAIVGPYRLDARRCISYLTIELKGSIPVELRPLIGNRIYGCDDCLAVCPWNRFAVKSSDPAVQPRSDLSDPDLFALLRLTEQEFKVKFANSPVLRTKRRGLLRNVCVALGNSKNPAALPHLDAANRDREPLVREHASWAIGEITAAMENKNRNVS